MRLHVRRNRAGPHEEWSTIELRGPVAEGLGDSCWEGASVSTALQFIQRRRDPMLAYALSCRRGVCNVCAIRIDGVVRTACTTPVRDGMRIEPARDSLVLRDTVIDVSLVRKSRVTSAGHPAVPAEGMGT
jgi:succinate dehydrogenase/fumarate reductase-like Fe-S protein